MTLFHGFTRHCLQCAAAYVIAARPSKAMQERHLSYLTRKGNLTRQVILQAVKTMSNQTLAQSIHAQAAINT